MIFTSSASRLKATAPDPLDLPDGSDGAPVISAYNVSKRFVTRRRDDSLKASVVQRLLRRQTKLEKGDFQALQGVSLEIGKGQTVGLIGHNGAGKSTLLKTITGILQPDDGEVHVLGRVASMLELGAGFNGELSGRDNVYLNAALLGLSRKETDALFDDIVEFSELGERIDDPVKVYSSGMYVKLGFAVAVHVDPDVLLIDEVLAVGDEKFQEKCIDRITAFQEQGKTILFVSHALDQVRKLCDRAIVLDHGSVVFDGDSDHAVSILRRMLGVRSAMAADASEPGDESVVLEPVAIEDATLAPHPGGDPRSTYNPGEACAVRVEVEIILDERSWAGGEVSVVVMGPGDVPLWVMRAGSHGFLRPVPGLWLVDFVVPALPPVQGPLTLAVAVSDGATGRVVAARRFTDALSLPGDIADGLLDVPHECLVPSARPRPLLPSPARGLV